MSTVTPTITRFSAPTARFSKDGLSVDRKFTTAGEDPFSSFRFVLRRAEIKKMDGSVVFELDDVEVPEQFEQTTVNVLADKYLRKAGVPQFPLVDGNYDLEASPILGADGQPALGPERSARQTMLRLANAWAQAAGEEGYFVSAEDVSAFRDEIAFMLMAQMAAPNSPQWFNTGLHEVWGIKGGSSRHFYYDPEKGEVVSSPFRYHRWGASACYILPVKDTLNDPDGVADFLAAEMALFKDGSGSGANLSALRARNEPLSSGGVSSGMMSWAKIADTNAGAVKSGGTTRRAAKMVIVNSDHPDVEEFVWAKALEERKAKALIAAGYENRYDGEAYSTVAFQNGNNSVRVDEPFMLAKAQDGTYALTRRTDGSVVKEIRARDLWRQIAEAAWECADPGVQFDTIINDWHTAKNAGRINASNPCFTGETLVATEHGTMEIELLAKRFAAGEELPRVWAFDESGRSWVLQQVTRAWQSKVTDDLVEVATEAGVVVRCTPDHRFLTQHGWVAASELTAGEELVALEGADRVAAVVALDGVAQVPVFDLTVAGAATFAVSSGTAAVCVHNCSEYLFLDATACNLASLNLTRFFDDDAGVFDTDAYLHALRLWTVVLEATVARGHYPTASVAEKSWRYRTLGLGYCNVGALLMRNGIAYDSDEGRAVMGALTALMHATAYETSAEMAAAVGPCAGYADNVEPMHQVLRNHRRAMLGTAAGPDEPGFDGLSVEPQVLDHDALARTRFAALSPVVIEQADAMLAGVDAAGYRNMQVTVLAPTGCLTPDTLVVTDRGLTRLGRLGNQHGDTWQDVDLEVATDDGPRKATKFYVNGSAPVVHLQTRKGYALRGTPEHRIKVVTPDGSWAWKRLGEISEGDLLPVGLDTMVGAPREVVLPPLGETHWTADFRTRVPRTVSAELAELVGYFMGDGSLHSKGLRFCVDVKDQDVLTRLSTLVEDLFHLSPKATSKGGYVELAVHSVPLALWWEACGFAKTAPDDHWGKGYTPRIPDAVLASNDREVYAGFLRGLTEADGTASVGGGTSLSSSHEGFLRDVQSVLAALGFPASLGRSEPSKAGNRMSKNALFRLRLLGNANVARWATEVGFIGARKASRVAEVDASRGTKGDRVAVPWDVLDELAPVGSPHRSFVTRARANSGGGELALGPRDGVEALFAETGDERLRHYLGFFYDPVVSTELGAEEMTLDLSVPDNVTYLANGFVSHNTISFIMAADTTGVEPAFSLVAAKKLAGGGDMLIVNQSVWQALMTLGYTDEQAREIADYVVEHFTIEGAPHLKDEHLPVFDCAVPGGDGVRSIEPAGHVRALGAVQPFLSGAASKTVNMPESASVADIEAVHDLAYELGVKCIAVYRDGSKGSQPLTTQKEEAPAAEVAETEQPVASAPSMLFEPPVGTSPSGFYGEHPVPKFRLPPARAGITFKAEVGGTELLLRTGEYPDGSLGEIFIDLSKEGSTLKGVLSCFAIAVSKGLQRGVPLEEYVETFCFHTFEPRGLVTGDDNVRMANSIMDYVFRKLAYHYLGREDLVQTPYGEDRPQPPLSVGSTRGGQVAFQDVLSTSAPAAAPKAATPAKPAVSKPAQPTGELCAICDGPLVPNGSCKKCTQCGATTGCS